MLTVFLDFPSACQTYELGILIIFSSLEFYSRKFVFSDKLYVYSFWGYKVKEVEYGRIYSVTIRYSDGWAPDEIQINYTKFQERTWAIGRSFLISSIPSVQVLRDFLDSKEVRVIRK